MNSSAATATRTHIDIGSRVRAVDRDNVGHVHDIDDVAGNCTVHFESTDGRTAIRTLTCERLVAIDNPDPVALTVAAADTLTHRGAVVCMSLMTKPKTASPISDTAPRFCSP